MNTAALHLVHSTRVIASARPLNQYQRQSIADCCLIHGASRFTVATEYGIKRRDVDEICDAAMFERGRRVGVNQTKFQPPVKWAA